MTVKCNRDYATKNGIQYKNKHSIDNIEMEAKGDWVFWISDLVRNPDGTDFNHCGEFRWAQLAKSTLLASTLGPLGSFQIF